MRLTVSCFRKTFMKLYLNSWRLGAHSHITLAYSRYCNIFLLLYLISNYLVYTRDNLIPLHRKPKIMFNK